MAHVTTEEILSAPGSYHQPLVGHACDTKGHEIRPSYRMIQLEPDVGQEHETHFRDLCQECYHEAFNEDKWTEGYYKLGPFEFE